MVDVKRSNLKLVERARRIFRSVLEPIQGESDHSTIHFSIDIADDAAVDRLIDDCDGSVKLAMVAARWSCTPEEARTKLEAAKGILRKALFPENLPVSNGRL